MLMLKGCVGHTLMVTAQMTYSKYDMRNGVLKKVWAERTSPSADMVKKESRWDWTSGNIF